MYKWKKEEIMAEEEITSYPQNLEDGGVEI